VPKKQTNLLSEDTTGFAQPRSSAFEFQNETPIKSNNFSNFIKTNDKFKTSVFDRQLEKDHPSIMMESMNGKSYSSVPEFSRNSEFEFKI
jgi:hypothetical protein